MRYEEAPFSDNKNLSRFELQVQGKTAFVTYIPEGHLVSLNHTEVPEEMEGQGVAEALVERTFRYIEENQLKVVPLCSYIQVFLKRHPEWNRLLAVQ